jgi:serine/threonine protein kinase
MTIATDALIHQRYRVIRSIGQGGMGAVYEALDERLKNRVALKQTLVGGEQYTRAFEREAQLLASLRHPALPRVIDHFSDESGQFLVMEFIPGDDLAAMLRAQGGSFSPDRVLGWADQLLDALAYLHAHDPPIVHRDIKPQNIKLTPRDEVILLDFGLAKGSPPYDATTAPSSLFGYTPQYAPLEQVRGSGTEPRSDLYSLAATLYQLLTFTAPHDVLSRAAASLNGQPDPLRPPRELNPQIAPAVERTLMQALALRLDERPFSAEAMRASLRAATHHEPQPTVAYPKTLALSGQPPYTDRTVREGLQDAPPVATLDLSGAALDKPVVRVRKQRRWLPLALVLLLLALSAGLTFIFTRSGAPSPLAAENLSANPGRSAEPQLLFDGSGGLQLVWRDSSLRPDGGEDVLARRLSGDTWGPPQSLSDQFDQLLGQPIAIERTADGRVCSIWHGIYAAGNLATRNSAFRCANGEIWGELSDVEQSYVSSTYITTFDRAGRPRTIYTFMDSTLYAGEDATGEEIVLSEQVNLAVEPVFAIDRSGGWHVAYFRLGAPLVLEYRFSDDQGQTWNAPFAVETGAALAPQALTMLTDTDGRLQLAWGRGGAVLYRALDAAGNWGETFEVTAGLNDNRASSIGLALGTDGLAHIVWQGDAVRYARQQADGSWSAPQTIAEVIADGPGPSIAVDNAGARHIAWADPSGARDIFYTVLP